MKKESDGKLIIEWYLALSLENFLSNGIYLEKTLLNGTSTLLIFFFQQAGGKSGGFLTFEENIRRIPDVRGKLMKWCFTKAQVNAELKRQERSNVDFTFCLKWYAHTLKEDGCNSTSELISPHTEVVLPENCGSNTIAAYVTFMLMEQLEYLSPDGSIEDTNI